MRINKYLPVTFAALFVFGWTAACQKDIETNRAAVNQPVMNSSADSKPPAANRSETTGADDFTVGSLATPTNAYKTAYTFRQAKDIEGLKKVFSKEALDFFAEVSKIDGKTLDENLKQLVEKPQASTAESRNEKINGDRATLEYLDESGNWLTMDFVKEGGEWKLTIPKMEPAEDKNTNK